MTGEGDLTEKEKEQHIQYTAFYSQLPPDFSSEVLASVITEPNYGMARELCLGDDVFSAIGRIRENLQQGLEKTPCFDKRTLDSILSDPERMNAEVFAGALRNRDFNARALYAAENGFITDENFGNACIIEELAYPRIAESLNDFYERFGQAIPVFTGFEGVTAIGERTTLGRDGSDITATHLAAAIHTHTNDRLSPIEGVVIATDTEGILKTDPEIVGDVVLLDNVLEISYDETDELADYGAKVLHPLTTAPIRKFDIPVRVIKGFDRKTEGTLITRNPTVDREVIKAISYQRDVDVVNVWVRSSKLAQPTVSRDISSVFSRAGVSVDHISSSIKVLTYTTTDTDKVDYLKELLEKTDVVRDVEIYRDRSSITLVGHGLGPSVGILHKASEALAEESIPIAGVLQPAEYMVLTFIVKKGDLERSVRALYRAFRGE